MKPVLILSVLSLCVSLTTAAQTSDSLKLSCPLNEIPDPPAEKKSYSLGGPDLKLVLAARTDTVVKACIDGIVTGILHDADGKWELIFGYEGIF